MKNKCCQILAAALTALALSAIPVRAAYVDITVNDGVPWTWGSNPQYGSDPRGINESGWVSPNCVANASWDLRAFVFDTSANKLTVVSGFNPLRLNEGVSIGDIFVDTNNSYAQPPRTSLVLTDPKIDPTKDGQFSYYNSSPGVGFEYAIHLIDPATGNLSYNIAALSGGSTLQSSAYNQNALSDPAKLIASGADTVLSSGLFQLKAPDLAHPNQVPDLAHLDQLLQFSDQDLLAFYGFKVGADGNYVYTFDLSGISLANGATFRLTTTCGNDLLVGQLAAGVAAAAVPETGTWVMGFLALGAMVFMVRRNARISA